MDQNGKNKEEDNLLLNSVKHGSNTNWEIVSDYLSEQGFEKSAKQCRER
jgi:hypothetical protein